MACVLGGATTFTNLMITVLRREGGLNSSNHRPELTPLELNIFGTSMAPPLTHIPSSVVVAVIQVIGQASQTVGLACQCAGGWAGKPNERHTREGRGAEKEREVYAGGRMEA